ncbi:hypothetical protein F4821DRAFT_232843 [Hypoxylon rubiginosum]|uniref:Uncharacterized protein n=1 Tax=Hypoxylon rubiginosum TaxID=110542 RepID=A0ACC0D800_9PEZI|nr:hypothetical protein F4821DRAFT_232843 [Hypoxylon rubiginosum]
MATPTLPANWTPDKQGCLRTNDYWIWDYEIPNDARTVLGGPSQTSDCFPSTWDATLTYAGSQCPPQYTSACQGTDSASAVTCCPTGPYSFACQPETWSPGVHAEQFRCQSKHTSGGPIVVTRTDFKKNTLNVGTRTRSTNEHLFALAMMYTTPASTPTSSTITATSTTDSSIPESSSQADSETSSSNFSTGKAAGVGAGVAVVVIVLAGLLAWFIKRRRKASRDQAQGPSTEEYYHYPPPPMSLPRSPVPSSPPEEMPTFKEPVELHSAGSIPHYNLHELPAK